MDSPASVPEGPRDGADDPYRPPQADLTVEPDELHQTRQKHIAAETNIKSIGSLVLLGGLVVLLVTVTTALGQGSVSSIGFVAPIAIVATLAAGVLLRRLDSRGRAIYTGFVLLVVVTSVPELVSGTYANTGGSLVLPLILVAALWTPKARTVFSQRYREVVIPATPDVKYRSMLAWVLLALLLLGLLAAIAIPSLM